MKVRAIFVMVIAFFVASLPAHSLPPQIEADMLMKEIGEASRSGNFKDLPEKFQRISELKAQVPDSFHFHWGKTLYEVNQYPSAIAHLDTYLTSKGTKAKFYEDALTLLSKSRIEMKKQKEEYDTAMREYEQKSSEYPTLLKACNDEESSIKNEFWGRLNSRTACIEDCRRTPGCRKQLDCPDALNLTEIQYLAIHRKLSCPSEPVLPKKPAWMN
ncbi:MAG TPA: hypothetical protein VFW93_12585 [Aquabacterium sp.]|uniref:tetratricopeptide repeat protein n=1 Tax=Aquabacterium sp. TaxID=1872578 RepID=UPI002E309276|nr:hypothetical protein [Aquabacterium sp.]HEX5357052.1 hypothetical protein [Aquabacterium sp.]